MRKTRKNYVRDFIKPHQTTLEEELEKIKHLTKNQLLDRLKADLIDGKDPNDPILAYLLDDLESYRE